MSGLISAVFQRDHRTRGQSLVEFALVAPVAIAMLAGIIQFGTVFWAQNTLTQIVRDTGRWAATQPNCSSDTPVIAQGQSIAQSSSLIGYSPANLGVTVTWDSPTCPINNTTVNYVHVTATARVPTFFPGMEYLPFLGTCDATGCHVSLSSTAQFRMEPNP
jgi:Flp pilus assembly protein TadG